MSIYIGLMSGTSLDGVDAVAVKFKSDDQLEVLGSASLPFSEELRTLLLSLCFSGPDEINKSQQAANRLAEIYSEACRKLLDKLKLRAEDIVALGAHGQTVRHNPHQNATTQLMNGALLAERTGIDTVIDFRSRDIAAGGQGAPLVPAFHHAVLASVSPRAVVNIGGISNVTFLGVKGEPEKTYGFDCGPGNMLLDAWIKEHLGREYDLNAEWAKQGTLDEKLLQALYDGEPYFKKIYPKSTGRELFNLQWLKKRVRQERKAENVQHTLTALTALAISRDISLYQPGTKEVFVCGGGARNPLIMHYLSEFMPDKRVCSTDVAGLNTQEVEGAAFAWLAKQFMERRPGNLPAVTGARGPRILGALYPC